MDAVNYQWIIIIVSSIVLFIISPYAKTAKEFFQGQSGNKSPNLIFLTSSLIISWVFAKSISNAASLGQSFGIVGGVAYAAYYLSFIVAGIIIYQLRTQGGFNSIHEFLSQKFGRTAIIVFSILIGIRLFNEVWSNTKVIGTYFGAEGSNGYIASIIVFTLLTLFYSLKGGLKSSIFTDLIQMFLFSFLLIFILMYLIPEQGSISDFVFSGEWTMAMGLNLFFTALLQIFSYPFHDPVMTDRGFISSPKVTLKSFFIAGIIGAIIIILFSFVGIYAKLNGIGSPAAVNVAKALGLTMMLVMNFIMITSAASTLDSTFSSVSKLSAVDLNLIQSEKKRFTIGHWAMIIVAVLGSLPLFFAPQVISATTISGTMVIGLAPVFVFWKLKVPKITFHLSVLIGLLSGVALVAKWVPEEYFLTSGKYADLLTVNIYGTLACVIVYIVSSAFVKRDENAN